MGPNDDADNDGYTPNMGDCNDCDPGSNPGAHEVPTPMGSIPADEDCDSLIDETPMLCDMNLSLSSANAEDGVKAIDICQTVANDGYGLISAAYTRANGTTSAGTPATPPWGILPDFGGASPQLGSNMLALSTGSARRPADPGDCGGSDCSTTGAGAAPAGFPQTIGSCDNGTTINDDIALTVTLQAPTNATGYRFRTRMYTFEWEEYVCTNYNDQAIVLANPAPMGAVNGNILFDVNNNPLSVNAGFFSVCDPTNQFDYASNCFSGCPAPPTPYCANGAGDLAGTQFATLFEDGGGTVWLETTAPVNPGQQFTLQFTIWDTDDSLYDSFVLFDSFEWLATPGIGVETAPT